MAFLTHLNTVAPNPAMRTPEQNQQYLVASAMVRAAHVHFLQSQQNQRVNTEKAGEQGTGKAARESGSGASQLGAGDSVQNAQGSNNAVAANTSQQPEVSSAAKNAASGATPAALPNASSSTAPSTGPLGAPSISNPSGSTILSVPVKGSGASAPTAPTR
ncbi:hypothetical protein OC845_004077, partial [Tilletia horrida]